MRETAADRGHLAADSREFDRHTSSRASSCSSTRSRSCWESSDADGPNTMQFRDNIHSMSSRFELADSDDTDSSDDASAAMMRAEFEDDERCRRDH